MPTGTPTKMKKCSICGDLFLPKKPSSRICPKDHFSNLYAENRLFGIQLER